MKQRRFNTKSIREDAAECDVPGIVVAKQRTSWTEHIPAGQLGRRLSPKRGPESRLAVNGGTFSEEALLQFIDECIAPVLADIYLRSRLSLPDPTEQVHTVDQL